MPRGDGTGPIGLGPMTRRGYCRQFYAKGMPGYARYAYSQSEEKKLLMNQQTALENQLKQVKERLSELGEDAE